MAEPTGAVSPSSAVSKPVTPLSFFEKLDLIPGLLSIRPFRSSETGDYTYKHHITHALVRKLGRRFNTAQLQFIATPFTKVYEQYCEKHQLTPNIVTLKSGVKAFWIGDPGAEYTVIYYHGGGFSLEGGPEHLGFFGADVYPALKDAGKSVSFLFLEYTLVPHGTYPIQFREAVEAVEYVTKDLGRSASRVILGGDSAGGNLCLAVLSHLNHPSPDVPTLKLDTKLKALILVAPWVGFEPKWPSSEKNKYKDIVTSETGGQWSRDYLGEKSSSPYAEAVTAEPSWWKSPQVEHIICVAGADELLVDPVSEWVDTYKSVNGADSVTFVVGQHEIHIAPIIEPILGDKAPTVQGEAIKSWMKARL